MILPGIRYHLDNLRDGALDWLVLGSWAFLGGLMIFVGAVFVAVVAWYGMWWVLLRTV